MRLAARTTSALFSQSPVCGVSWGTEMGWSLPGGRGFVAVGRCARGQPRPVLRFCRRNVRRCPGVLYVHKARTANRVCSGVQVVFSWTPPPPTTPTNGQLQPSRACTGIQHTNKDCVYTVHGTSPHAVARIGAATKSPPPAVDIPFGLTARCTSIKHRLYLAFLSPQSQPFTLQQPPCIHKLRSPLTLRF